MKKSQATMEFLMVYGWSILVVIIVIGALYFVVLNPDLFSPLKPINESESEDYQILELYDDLRICNEEIYDLEEQLSDELESNQSLMIIKFYGDIITQQQDHWLSYINSSCVCEK